MINDQSDTSRSILVATDADNALVRITGWASFATGPTFKQLGAAMIERQCKRFVLDMGACEGVDSTFLGVIAGLASRMKDSAGKLIMINLSPPIHETVSVLGLNRIIECHETGKCPDDLRESLGRLGELSRLEIDESDSKIARKTAIEAHEELIRSDERNLPRFRDVLAFLREKADTNK